MTSQEHNKALGISHLAYGGFHLLLMLFISLMFFVVMAVPRELRDDEAIYTIMMWLMVALGLLFSIPSLLAGYALLKHKPWARKAAIVAGVLATPSFPYGTALGVYTLWFMFGNEGRDFYAHLAGHTEHKPGALPGAPVSGDWTAGVPQGGREREYAPPPRMPDWR